MAFGEILRNARVQKGLTPSDVAESTHMLVQIVESLEHEDFRRIAAPIYGRGFVKLYAELLELDPEPLVSDFMRLYNGVQAPVVRTKQVELPNAPVPEDAPAPLAQADEPERPVVRKVEIVIEEEPLDDDTALEEIWMESAALDDPAEPEAAPAPPPPAGSKKDFRPTLVVEPEAAFAAESNEPDLFNPRPLTKPPADDQTAADNSDGRAANSPKRKRPIFQVGSWSEEDGEAEARAEAARARWQARTKVFMNGVAKLKNRIGGWLPDTMPKQQALLIGGVGLVLVALMITGIGMLFKMTGGDTTTGSGARVENIAPPPPLYVD